MGHSRLGGKRDRRQSEGHGIYATLLTLVEEMRLRTVRFIGDLGCITDRRSGQR